MKDKPVSSVSTQSVESGFRAKPNPSSLVPPASVEGEQEGGEAETLMPHTKVANEETDFAQCPFCGDNHVTVAPLDTLNEDSVNPIYFVQCDNIHCGASGPPDTYDRAKEKWNRSDVLSQQSAEAAKPAPSTEALTTAETTSSRWRDLAVLEDGTPVARSGVSLIAEERGRQVSQEGWTPEHDDTHRDSCLAVAAASYALEASSRTTDQKWWGPEYSKQAAHLWPFDQEWWKPCEPIRQLVKAGAMIAAEIDRLQRARGLQPTASELPAKPTQGEHSREESGEMPLSHFGLWKFFRANHNLTLDDRELDCIIVAVLSLDEGDKALAVSSVLSQPSRPVPPPKGASVSAPASREVESKPVRYGSDTPRTDAACNKSDSAISTADNLMYMACELEREVEKLRENKP